MPRNDSLEMGELTDTSYYILLALIEPMHGYLIMNKVENMTNNRVSIGPASLYTTIKKLVKAGLIELVEEAEKKKKTYVTTEKGIKLIKQEMDRKREMILHAEEIFTNIGDGNNG
ncbi:PadR family transcriptional regulator [Bacillus spongiae]|uniref:PadR family transcriptional regulator n=1 Tax=Bacillus spongiae TaxID=2683610 RepID=A0ABU8HBV5_9BACI